MCETSIKYPIKVPNDVKSVIMSEYPSWCNRRGIIMPRIFEKYASDCVKSWIRENEYPIRLLRYIHDNDVDEINEPRCETCGRPLSFDNMMKGIRFCSSRCVANSKNVQHKRERTNIEKYGSKNCFGSKEIQEKIKNTLLEKYGVEHPAQNDVIKHKMQKTNLERYGCKSPFGNDSVKKKIKSTMVTRYGTAFPFTFSSEKVTKTMMLRYGVNVASKCKRFVDKAKRTNLERYGVDNASKCNFIREKIRTVYKSKYWDSLIAALSKKNISVLPSKDEYVNDDRIRLKCDVCGYEWARCGNHEKYGNRPQYIVCECCSKKKYSNEEKELLRVIRSYTSENIIENDRSVLDGKELDIYIPTLKLAFEFDGTYYHNSNGVMAVPKTYHREKSVACRNKGIRLVHVFEHEWRFSREKILNLIKTALNVFDRTVYARQCVVHPISSNEYTEFLDAYHLQGSVRSSVRYGLFYNDEIVSVIGIGCSRFKRGETELHRYCVKPGWRIIGGFSKLLKHCGCGSMVSYVDLSHFSGAGYRSVGFIEDAMTVPNYVYIKGNHVVSRYSAQKHKLKKLLGESFNPAETEVENMTRNGWFQVYDSGQLRMVYHQ